ncbi:hypothetical protein PJE062_1883 [Pseudovibrio sp. JE062]|nr:hypothetical protein PJE062_1883 [Pseudovibrio sp. JE062]
MFNAISKFTLRLSALYISLLLRTSHVLHKFNSWFYKDACDEPSKSWRNSISY